MPADVRCFTMLGPPASGKGTQGRLLAERLGIAYLSTGARLRREIEEGSPLGQRAQVFLDRNQYVPDSLAVELVKSWVLRHEEGWLLDGFPRSIPQAEALLEFAPQAFTVIHLSVPEEELRSRVVTRRECISCGFVSTNDHKQCPKCGGELEARADDSAEGFEKRFQAYQSLTIPALELLKTRTTVVTIEGLGSREEVAGAIQDQLT
ncbi:adenylate kinase family protein [Roseibacillus persicicus]|uniref:Adenylate kinase n=1 Tax=Roseibacillus persicicus TaxID=454148 RepID=A0A918TGD4_9BACT|nr:nucleoside monophosphate kinase [Roseibacillus persicicus]GHC44937.1 adenylate kinase [Roseibacillus persicicus]